MLKSLREFAASLRWWWVSIVIGHLMGAIAFWQSLVDTQAVPASFPTPPLLPAWVLWAASYLAIAAGSFAAFHKVRAERDELKEIRPRLKADILAYTLHGDGSMAVYLRVFNSGQPSTIPSQSWSVTVVTKQGKLSPKLVVEARDIENDSGVLGGYEYPHDSQIVVQGSKLIEYGGEIVGPIHCILPNGPLDNEDIISITVGLTDFEGRPSSDTAPRMERTNALPYFAGLKQYGPPNIVITLSAPRIEGLLPPLGEEEDP